MSEMSLNLFDLGVLLIVGLSALLSFYRGFVKEMLSLGSWIVASVVTLRFLEPVTQWVKPQVHSEPVAAAIAAIGLFLATLIGISIGTGLLLKALKPGDRVGLLDNLAGLAFGIARGLLIVGIAYFVMSKFFTDEKNYPKLVRNAITRPYVAECARWLGSLTPDYLDHVMKKKPEAHDDEENSTARDADDKEAGVRVIRPSKSHQTKRPSSDEDSDADGYSMPSIEDLQERIRKENEKHNVR